MLQNAFWIFVFCNLFIFMEDYKKIKDRVIQDLANKLASEAIQNPNLLEQIKEIGNHLGLPIEEILNKKPDENTFSF